MNDTQTSKCNYIWSPLTTVIVWVVLVLIGYWIYGGTNPECTASRLTAMQRDFFRPDWYAGKLGESFANQTFRDGVCHFHAFSRLKFLRPADFHQWDRMKVRLRLPADSFVLFLLESADSDKAQGIRVGRSLLYPSGFLTFSGMRAEHNEWIHPDLAILPVEDSFFDVRIERQGHLFILIVNGLEWSRWTSVENECPTEISIIAGPTGLILDEIEVCGRNDQKLPIIIRDDFSPLMRVPSFISLWWPRVAIFGGILLFLLSILLITKRFLTADHLSFFFLGVVSWFTWPMLCMFTSSIGVFVVGSMQLLLTALVWMRHLKWSDRRTGPDFAKECSAHTPGHMMSVCFRIGLTILVICGGFWLLWEQSRRLEMSAEDNNGITSQTEIELSTPRRVHVGEKYFLTDTARNFFWQTTVYLPEQGISEWVLRKYRGPDADYSSWYTVTLSDDPAHVSGIYSTRQNYQVLLTPLGLDTVDTTHITMTIRFVGEQLTVQVDNNGPITLRASERYVGEVSLVPITHGLKLKSSIFRELPYGPSFFERLGGLWIIMLGWCVVVIAIAVRWERTTGGRLSSPRRTLGLCLIYSPLLFLVIVSITGYQQPRTLLLITATGVAALLHCVLVHLSKADRRFFSLAEIVIVLLCIEAFLRIDPLDPRVQENPLQVDIPPHLYWYRAASARRWNSYIKHNMFRNGVHTAPFNTNRHQLPIRRIMCLGSSSTAGGYPQYIDAAFKDAGYSDVEVIDGGVPGTTTLHLVNFYQGCLAAFQSDIVTLCLIRNDMKFLALREAQRTFDQETTIRGRSPWQTRMYYWLNKMMLYRIYRFYLTGWFSALSHKSGPLISTAELNEKNLAETLELHVNNLRNFVETARSHQQLPVLIIEPFFVSDGFDVLPEERKTRTISSIYELGERLDVTVIDMQKIIDEDRHSLYFIDDVHNNDEGKRFIGVKLFQALRPFVDQIERKSNQRNKGNSINSEVILQH